MILLFLNMVRKHPILDQHLISAAKNPKVKNIRIHLQTYICMCINIYQVSILAKQFTFECIIPNEGSFLKAIYFPFAATAQSSGESFTQINIINGLTSLAGRWMDSTGETR